jgi:probable rRNA maturation factor
VSIMISDEQDRVKVTPKLRTLIRRVARSALGTLGGAVLSIALVDDSGIRDLNRRYRDLDEPTDVLSFPMGEEGVLGDVVLNLERATKQAAEFGHGMDREVAYLLTHGILHLSGYGHEDAERAAVMREREESILSEVGLGR